MTAKTQYAFLRLLFNMVLPLFLGAVFGSYLLIPNSYWFEVKTVFVENSTVGIPPKMVVSRQINRPFIAAWIVTVKRIDTVPRAEQSVTLNVTPGPVDTASPEKVQSAILETAFSVSCTATSTSNYKVGTSLPPNIDLNWWTFPIECKLPAGTYVVETSWTFTEFLLDRTIEATSNVFQVKPTHVVQ